MTIALDVLKSKIPYKYTVFSPRSAVADNPYEFIHDTSSRFPPGLANRTLNIPEHLQDSEGMFAKLSTVITPFRAKCLNAFFK